MTMQRALTQLDGALVELWCAVGELIIIVVESQPQPAKKAAGLELVDLRSILRVDRPRPVGLAVVDDMAALVSDIQGDVAAARTYLAADAAHELPRLSSINERVQAVNLRYWHKLRTFDAIAQLKASTRRAEPEWVTFEKTLVASIIRCQAPLENVVVAMHDCWQEVEQLIRSAFPLADPPQEATSETRRKS